MYLFFHHEEQDEYHNYIQIIPLVYNAIGLFCKDDDSLDSISIEDLEKIAAMAISLTDSKEDPLNYLAQITINNTTKQDHLDNILSRLDFIFNYIELNFDKSLSFNNVVGIDLEHVLLPFISGISSGIKISSPPLIDLKTSFHETNISQDTLNYLEEYFKKYSISTDAFIKKVQNSLKGKNKVLDKSFCPFFDRPFLYHNDKFLLTGIHYSINSLVDFIAKLYIESYNENPNNKASQAYGIAFEAYIKNIILQTRDIYEFEPLYNGSNKNDKGTDIVSINKNSAPLLIEITKRPVYRSLTYNYSFQTYQEFICSLSSKFDQTLKWLRSHGGIYNDVNIKKGINNSIIIVCISQPLAVSRNEREQDFLHKTILKIWSKNFPSTLYKPKKYIFHVFGINEIEELATAAIYNNLSPKKILIDYRDYLNSTTFITKDLANNITIRDPFINWLQSKYEIPREYREKNKVGNKLFERIVNLLRTSN